MIPSTTLNANIAKLFCGLHSMLLLLPTAAILEATFNQYPVNTFRSFNFKQKMSEFSFTFLLRHYTHQVATPILSPLASASQQCSIQSYFSDQRVVGTGPPMVTHEQGKRPRYIQSRFQQCFHSVAARRGRLWENRNFNQFLLVA